MKVGKNRYVFGFVGEMIREEKVAFVGGRNGGTVWQGDLCLGMVFGNVGQIGEIVFFEVMLRCTTMYFGNGVSMITITTISGWEIQFTVT